MELSAHILCKDLSFLYLLHFFLVFLAKFKCMEFVAGKASFVYVNYSVKKVTIYNI